LLLSVVLATSGCSSSQRTWRPSDPDVTYEAQSKLAWMTWDDEMVAGKQLIGTLSYRYMANKYGAGGPQRKDIRRDAADRGGEYVIESGSDRKTRRVPEWQSGSLLSVPKEFVCDEYEVYRNPSYVEPEPVKTDDAQSQLLAGLRCTSERYPATPDQYYKAIEHYSRAIALKPDLADAYRYRAEDYYELYEWGGSNPNPSHLLQALVDCAKALELGSKDSEVDFTLSRVANDLMVAKNIRYWEKALPDLNRMLERTPQNAFLLAWRSRVRGNMGDSKGALADMTQAISLLDKRAPEIYWRSGQLKARSGDFPGAIADLTSAIDSTLSMSWRSALKYRLDRGDARYASGDLKGAMSDFDVLIRQQWDRACSLDAQLRRALLKLQQGDPQGAIEDLDRQVKSAPSVTHHAVALGMAYWAAGKEEDARAIWKWVLAPPEADRSKVDRKQACRYMARLLATSRDKKVRDPGRALKLVLSIAPDVKTALSFDLGTMAAAYAASGDPQRAAMCQAQAAQNTPRRFPFARSVRRKRVALYRKGESLHLNPMEVFFDPGTGWVLDPN
jgi:tetratricopeptide (TPR) repeat protein